MKGSLRIGLKCNVWGVGNSIGKSDGCLGDGEIGQDVANRALNPLAVVGRAVEAMRFRFPSICEDKQRIRGVESLAAPLREDSTRTVNDSGESTWNSMEPSARYFALVIFNVGSDSAAITALTLLS